MHSLPEALTPLSTYHQFIVYKLIQNRNRPEKIDKLPVDHRTGQVFVKNIDWQNDPSAWTTAENAIDTSIDLGAGYGVGFLFTTGDPFWFIDIDNCAMVDGSWSPIAMDLMTRTPNCAVEISQSGTGLHIFGTGLVPEHSCKNISAGLELYTKSRFAALTGTNIIGNASTPVDLTSIVNQYFTPSIKVRSESWTSDSLPEYTPFVNDEKLIAKARMSKSAANKFTGSASFNDLWVNNIGVLADTYSPDASSENPYDGSSADMALASALAFWTGCNCEHIENLMWVSALVRDKWTRHTSYLRDTILKAISLQESVYTAGERPRISVHPSEAANSVRTSSDPVIVEGFQFLAVTQQVEHFKGCVYIQDIHKVFTPQGVLLKQDQFNATYGGYVFQLDDAANGKTTKKAWDAFTESQMVRYPKATSSCFRPNEPSGCIIDIEGCLSVNTYVPINTLRQQGDISPFLTHLAKLLPNVNDQEILISYMAAIVQHKGVKFQWAPLIQGVEGNGKTLFSRCVAFAIGERYTHMPPAEQIAEKFNAWMFNKIFIGVEDIYVPDHKLEIIEVLKPMITNTRYAKRDMGVGQIMQDICCNFIFNSNHKDAVRKTKNDRRFSIFYTAQQTIEDLKRDGMDCDYFPNLYKWLRSGGYASIASYLDNYTIPAARNPAGACHRAPTTTSTVEAVENSLGGVEQEIQECIDEGRPGFAGGWISSVALQKLLENINADRRIPLNKRRAMLQTLGYDWHPSLNRGRTTSFVAVDNHSKSRLFIREGHVSYNLKTNSEIVKAYSDAQLSVIASSNAFHFKQC